ncbi:hypothetical protein PARPLA_03050 [Rhodobacteraceae bacterium THAF1]|uniref:DsbA family protein n=1 Tax=Palleronia sp. THAF1 TaxID=2587842 RepID=UPI000F419C9E|nr:hypothetical protein [Palleronia sp. THAF1]QFU08449.1 hypothetical protein FIU81_07160 [Palleronia sp. THAF1]VDC29324.1 hypothetical protein PARPLA_03050 [Rhodobacteraceae bacterium THAF1]
MEFLQKGQGDTLVEWFLEPTCPFSSKAFGKLDSLLDRSDGALTVRLWLHSQPWHLNSPLVTRCIIAAWAEHGAEAAWDTLGAVFAHRESYAFTDHAGGPNRAATPNDIIERIESHSRLSLAVAFDWPELADTVKAHTKYARQNGIHSSPSVLVNGFLREDIESGDSVDDWLTRIV